MKTKETNIFFLSDAIYKFRRHKTLRHQILSSNWHSSMAFTIPWVKLKQMLFWKLTPCLHIHKCMSIFADNQLLFFVSVCAYVHIVIEQQTCCTRLVTSIVSMFLPLLFLYTLTSTDNWSKCHKFLGWFTLQIIYFYNRFSYERAKQEIIFFFLLYTS